MNYKVQIMVKKTEKTGISHLWILSTEKLIDRPLKKISNQVNSKRRLNTYWLGLGNAKKMVVVLWFTVQENRLQKSITSFIFTGKKCFFLTVYKY